MDSALRAFVLARDGGCVARLVNSAFHVGRFPMLKGLPDPGPCRNQWGDQIVATRLDLMEADHVKDELGMSIREDDPAQLWTMCPFHHRGKQTTPGWATLEVVRVAARIYIAAANAFALRDGWPILPRAFRVREAGREQFSTEAAGGIDPLPWLE